MNLIFLHGRPASGKLTTARALQELLGYPVFHNHLVVDLLTPIFPFGSDPFIRLREQFWMAVFNEAAVCDRSITFTCTPDDTVPVGFPQRVTNAVNGSGGRVRFVRLTVDDEEQERRVIDPGRREFFKLADLDSLRRLRGGPVPEQPPVELEIDTMASSPHNSAAQIAERFGLQPQPRTERYPSDTPG
jgi:AAA domain